MSDLIQIAVDAGIGTVTMNRPDVRNALNATLVDALSDAFDQLVRRHEVRVIVLTGAGKAFSAGADLAALNRLQSASQAENVIDSTRLARLFESMYRCPKPLIAQVNGHAIAGGAGLVAACDLAFVASHAKLGFTEVRIGFVPAIILQFVVRKLGETRARDLLLTGRLIDGETAASYGLVTQACASEDLDERVRAVASGIVRETSETAVALTKSLFAATQGAGFEDALNAAIHANAFARSTPDCRAGVEAFLSKSDPPWRKAASDASETP
ncbi:MAG: enoyl-CoA hydratase-related protein [Bacteroidota bacterium]